MKLTAHVFSDGAIHSFVVQPEGDVIARLVPEPGVEAREIIDHDIKSPVDFERLQEMGEGYIVAGPPAEGKLVRRQRRPDG